MNNIQLLTAIFVFVWTSLSTTFSAYSQINKIRDEILIGKIGNDKITLEHKQLLWNSDWKSLMFGVIFRSFIFCILISFLPFLVCEEHGGLTIIGVTIAAFSIPFMTLAGSIKHYFLESNLINKKLKKEISE